MPSPEPIDFKAGKLTGFILNFKKSGDVLSRHFHSVGEGHITIVVSGSVKIDGKNWSKVYKIGNVVDLPVNEFHEITSLEDSTKILNINK
jgi:quercetin dioxygenase-like cupin family protein